MSFPAGYQLAESQTCMTLAGISYADDSARNYPVLQAGIQAALTQISPSIPGTWTLVWLGISPDWGNLMYVARDTSTSGRYAVSVRGTVWKFLSNIIEDLDVFETTGWPLANPPNPGIQVAKGSWMGLGRLRNMTSAVFNMSPPAGVAGAVSLADFLQALAAQGGLEIFVTGHSLGGAMATILTSYLAETATDWNFPAGRVSIKTYTFAAPTVGNQEYALYYNRLSSNTKVGMEAFRIFNKQDMVPYAFSNLRGLGTNGVPITVLIRLGIEAVVIPVNFELDIRNIHYVHVGKSPATAIGLDNIHPNPAPGCPNPARLFYPDYACWVDYEHDHNTYLHLLGTPGISIVSSPVGLQ